MSKFVHVTNIYNCNMEGGKF